MESILANKTTSINKVKKSPTDEINGLDGDAAAIYNRSEISAYLVSKERFTELCQIEEKAKAEATRQFVAILDAANEGSSTSMTSEELLGV